MKNHDRRIIAPVITLPEFRKKTERTEDNEMKKQQLSIDCYRKLRRSCVVSSCIFSDLETREIKGIHQLYIPYLFSYLSDDIKDINEELEAKGLFDEWLRQERDNLDNE